MIELTKVLIEIEEGRLIAKRKKKEPSIGDIVFLFIFSPLVPTVLMIYGLIDIIRSNEGWSYFIMGAVFILIYLPTLLYTNWKVSKIDKINRLMLDESGVTQTEIDKTYHLDWNEVQSWGYVNHNHIGGMRGCETKDDLQVCLYFSKNEHSEKELRKKFRNIHSFRRNMHVCKDDIIVYQFFQYKIDHEIVEKINGIIKLYCAEGSECSYIDPNDLYPFNPDSYND